jgi:DNA-binding NarL/FixJ family response regulator
MVLKGDDAVRIRVLLVDDESLVRAGLSMLIDAEDDMVVVGEAEEGSGAIAMTMQLRPDVVVMDVKMPGMNGVDATRTLTSDRVLDAAGGAVPVLILTTFTDDDAVLAALKAGASGFILKSAAPKVLATAIRALADGAGWLDPAVTLKLLAEFANRPDPGLPAPAQMSQLTRRESEILRAVAHGFSNAQIAAHLVLSEATVKTHLGRILMKLGLHDRAQAVAVAYKTGLVKPDDAP